MNDHVNPRAVIGGNSPPLEERLPVEEAALVTEVQEIADRANSLPKKVADILGDPDIAVIGGVIRDALALEKRVDKRRVEVKAPYLAAERAVDGFFNGQVKRLNRITDAFDELVRSYRADVRRREAEAAAEKARAAQAEEAKRRAEAEEAERKGRERTAALAKEKADLAARQAEEARERQAQIEAPPPPQLVKTEVAEGLTMKAKGEWVHKIEDVRLVNLETLRPYLKLDHVEAAIKLAIRQGVRDVGPGVKIFQQEKVDWK